MQNLLITISNLKQTLAGIRNCLINYIITIILALIQGIAEWLPISSTAHLRVAEHFLGFQATPLFNVFLHIGTLGVVIFYFRHDIKIILTCSGAPGFSQSNTADLYH